SRTKRACGRLSLQKGQWPFQEATHALVLLSQNSSARSPTEWLRRPFAHPRRTQSGRKDSSSSGDKRRAELLHGSSVSVSTEFLQESNLPACLDGGSHRRNQLACTSSIQRLRPYSRLDSPPGKRRPD